MSTRVYLDTSVISALFDARTPERQAQTLAFWEQLDAWRGVVSDLVLSEIEDARTELKVQMLDKIADFDILITTEEAQTLAAKYLAQGIFPQKYSADALHVALASSNSIGILVSWNFTHLVKVKTRRMVSLVNAGQNYPIVEIISPPEL